MTADTLISPSTRLLACRATRANQGDVIAVADLGGLVEASVLRVEPVVGRDSVAARVTFVLPPDSTARSSGLRTVFVTRPLGVVGACGDCCGRSERDCASCAGTREALGPATRQLIQQLREERDTALRSAGVQP